MVFGLAALFILGVHLVSAVPLVPAATFSNPVYIITNAETPSLNLPGLTPVGKQRVEVCLPNLLYPLDVGLVITCAFDKKSGLCAETVATATPIANNLGANLTTQCGAGSNTADDCLVDLMENFAKTSTQSMLVVWDLSGMDDLFDSLGVDDGDDNDQPQDSDDGTPHYDIIWTVIKGNVVNVASQNCTGLDGQAPGTFRRTLLQRAKSTSDISSRTVRRT